MTAGVVLDSNLLLLYAAGVTSRAAISKLKRLRAYSDADFDVLVQLLGRAPRIVLTPNTLTETSNLIRLGAQTPAARDVMSTLKHLLDEFGETYVGSAAALDIPEASALGVTDAVLLILTESKSMLITSDLDLWVAATKAGKPAINFNHVREMRL